MSAAGWHFAELALATVQVIALALIAAWVRSTVRISRTPRSPRAGDRELDRVKLIADRHSEH